MYAKRTKVPECRGCQAPIEWYDTLTALARLATLVGGYCKIENGKKMPMNHGAAILRSEHNRATGRRIALFDAAESHWTTCPARALFRRR